MDVTAIQPGYSSVIIVWLMDWEWMEEENKKSFGVVVNEVSR